MGIVSHGDTSSNGEAASTARSEIDELFGLIHKYCSNEQLRHFVRVYRPAERDYAISGNRDHLKSAVLRLFNSGYLPRPKLEALLERAEENGRQHVFLYTPLTKDIGDRLNNFDSMEKALLEGQTRAEAGLPAFRVRPKGVVVADMRKDVREGTAYSSWTYKLYAGSETWRMVGKPDIHGDEKIVRYKLKYDREVLLVKWHSFGLLEIRIPTGNSRQQITLIRQRLINKLSEALADSEPTDEKSLPSSFTAMAEDFKPASKRLKLDAFMIEAGKLLVPLPIPVTKLDAAARSGDIKWISFNEIDYDVDGHTVTVAADDATEDLYQNSTLATALEKVKDCKRLNALIHVREQPEFLEKLPVEFCPNVANEFRVASETSPEVVEFIIRRVWEFAKGADSLPVSPVDSIVTDDPKTSDLANLDFDEMAQEYPYLANALLRLDQWVKEHPTADYLDPARLQKALGTGLHAPDLAVAVAKLVEDGILTRKYRVRPSGRRQALPHLFASLDELLDKDIEDEDGEPVDLGNASVVPVYGKAGTPTP